jgi:hypothetical protein
VDEDFDGALRASFDQLGGENSLARKGQIFLAQAERDMPYLNSHLRLAFDASKVVDPGTSDPPLEPSLLAPIPTCAIERKAAETADTAVLTRMAEQTGGYFVRSPPSQDLLVAFFRCVNRFFGYAEATSVLTSHTSKKPWDTRLFGRRIRLDRDSTDVGRRSFETRARRMRFLITADQGGRGGPLTGIGLRLGKGQNAKRRRVNTRKNGFLALRRLRALDRIPGIEVNVYPAARGNQQETSIRSWKDAVEIVVDLKLHPRGSEIQVRARKGRALRVSAMKWAPGIAARNPR